MSAFSKHGRGLLLPGPAAGQSPEREAPITVHITYAVRSPLHPLSFSTPQEGPGQGRLIALRGPSVSVYPSPPLLLYVHTRALASARQQPGGGGGGRQTRDSSSTAVSRLAGQSLSLPLTCRRCTSALHLPFGAARVHAARAGLVACMHDGRCAGCAGRESYEIWYIVRTRYGCCSAPDKRAPDKRAPCPTSACLCTCFPLRAAAQSRRREPRSLSFMSLHHWRAKSTCTSSHAQPEIPHTSDILRTVLCRLSGLGTRETCPDQGITPVSPAFTPPLVARGAP